MIVDRIMQLIDLKGINKRRFYLETGLSNGFLDKVKDIGASKIEQILNTYPDVNPIWLLTGTGQMTNKTVFFENVEGIDPIYVDEPLTAYFKNNQVKEWSKEQALKEPKANYFKLKTDNAIAHQSVPLYDVQASASVVALFRDKNSEKPIDHITIPNLPKCDGAIYVSGDSMYPLLKSGDIIMYKKVANAIENMFWGEMYLVSLINDDGDEFVMVKWLHKSEKGDEYVKLVSENRHHQPKDFHIKNIKGLALIKASVRVNSMY